MTMQMTKHINNYANDKHSNYNNTDQFNVITSACHDSTVKSMPFCNGKVQGVSLRGTGN